MYIIDTGIKIIKLNHNKNKILVRFSGKLRILFKEMFIFFLRTGSFKVNADRKIDYSKNIPN